jgi:hypothetical protein
MPAPHLHLTFGMLVKEQPQIRPALRAACEREPVYTRLGSIFHDLPYYGNMIFEAIRYGLASAALDEPWAYRMHAVRPGHFIASFIRAAATSPAELGADERLALVGGLVSHAALDLVMHPLVNYCARRDAAAYGGHESWHHRQAEIHHALYFHQERLGFDPVASGQLRRWTRVVKRGSLVRARVEAPLTEFVRDAYRGCYGGAPDARTWARWVRSFQHFGQVVSNPMAARKTREALRSAALRDRYFDNDVFRFMEFYACAERRVGELANLAYDYFAAGDFSPAAEERFVAAARVDDLAEPEPQACDNLPHLPRLAPVRNYRLPYSRMAARLRAQA